MAWPTSKPNSNKFSSDGDSIKDSRPELKTMSDAVNNIVDFIDTSSIANNKILKYNSTSGALEFVTESGGGGGGLANVVEDTSPQLGGNLDMNGQQIVTTSNGNIKLYPNGTGVVEVGGDGASADGTIQLNCSQNSHGIKLASPPHSAGQSYTLTFPSTAPASGKILQTDGSGNLSFVDLPSAVDTQIVAGTGISVSQPDSGGAFTITNTAPSGGSISPLTENLDVKTFEIGNLTIDSAGEVSPMAMNFSSGNDRVINMYNKDYGNLTAFLQNYDPGRANNDYGGLALKSFESSNNRTTTVSAETQNVEMKMVKSGLPTGTLSIALNESYGINIDANVNDGFVTLHPESSIRIVADHGKILLGANDGITFRNSYTDNSGQQITFTSKGNYLNDYKLVFPASLSNGPLFVTQVTADSAGDPIEQYDISVGGLRNLVTDNEGLRSSDFTAAAGDSYIISASLTVDLPASPQQGDRVEFIYITTGTVTVARNGSNINGSASNLTNTTKGADCFVYTDATEGWRNIY
jgi:hypothetical protein